MQDRDVMDKAIDVHDHVIRTLLPRYNGYEVTTEGDAFLLAFHEASDAVAWNLATQQVCPQLLSSITCFCPKTPLYTWADKLSCRDSLLLTPEVHPCCHAAAFNSCHNCGSILAT